MYTIGCTITEAVDECIQARFGGVGLPSAVKDLQIVVTNLSDFVAVQVHSGLVRFRAIRNLSVCRFEVDVRCNCSVHLCFDLTHDWCRLVDFYRIHEMRQGTTDAVPLCSLVSEHAEVGINHEVDHLVSGRTVVLVTEPVHCHISRAHRVKHEVLQVLQGLGIGEECFVHVSTIHGLRCCAYFVCHLVNCPTGQGNTLQLRL